MNETSNDVPCDPDTTAVALIPIKLEDIDNSIEGWYCKDVTGISAVIAEMQVSELNYQEPIRLTPPRLHNTRPYTVSRNQDGYAFINCGFGEGD